MKNLIALFSVLTLAACGFHPVYGVNKYTAVGVETDLARIEISNIPDRDGQYLRNELIDRFYREGRPDSALYVLNVSPVRESLIDLDITKSADTTRGQMRLDTRIVLIDRRTGQNVLERDIRSISSYNMLGGEFTNRVSEDSTRLNALEDLARQIEMQVALYLKRNR